MVHYHKQIVIFTNNIPTGYSLWPSINKEW